MIDRLRGIELRHAMLGRDDVQANPGPDQRAKELGLLAMLARPLPTLDHPIQTPCACSGQHIRELYAGA
jgi:hypothetical protein